MVSLTGGLTAGRSLMRGAAVNVKRVALELGGKSPNIMFADSDFETAVDNALTAAFTHSGPGLLGRLPGDRPGQDLRPVRRRDRPARGPDPASGPGCDDATEAGALISAEHRAKVEGYVAGRHRRGRPARRRRPPPRRARAAGRLLLPPDGLRRLSPRRWASSAGGLRSGPDDRALLDRGGGDRARQRHDVRAGRRGLDRRRRPGPARRRRGCATGRSGSTTTTRTCRRPSGAASSSRGSAASSGTSGLDEYREAKHIWQNTAPGPTGWFGG